jgi:hypothetical protein
MQQTAKQSLPTHWNVHSSICLHHAALDSFLNEEITIREMLTNTPLANGGHKIQGMTLHSEKLSAFFAFFGLKDRQTPEISRRALLLAGLRNRLSHHWPEMRDMRDYPIEVTNALNDARIEPVNTSWAAQCSDVRLAEWAADIVRAFVDEWWRIGRDPGEFDRLQWVFGPDWVYPSEEPAPSKS